MYPLFQLPSFKNSDKSSSTFSCLQKPQQYCKVPIDNVASFPTAIVQELTNLPPHSLAYKNHSNTVIHPPMYHVGTTILFQLWGDDKLQQIHTYTHFMGKCCTRLGSARIYSKTVSGRSLAPTSAHTYMHTQSHTQILSLSLSFSYTHSHTHIHTHTTHTHTSPR